MRKTLPEKLEAARITTGLVASCRADGAYGCFNIHGPCGERLHIIASGADDDDPLADGWEHVSISTPRRTPNWLEMCFVKDLFWDPEECVVQFHPPRSQYINNHPHCLHLWRHKRHSFPMPPEALVGKKGLELQP